MKTNLWLGLLREDNLLEDWGPRYRRIPVPRDVRMGIDGDAIVVFFGETLCFTLDANVPAGRMWIGFFDEAEGSPPLMGIWIGIERLTRDCSLAISPGGFTLQCDFTREGQPPSVTKYLGQKYLPTS